jgi:two-component system cell cycle response regulator
MSHLATLVEQSAERQKPLSALILDIDFFKAINDGHGHDAGDDVLREFAVRIRKSIRGIDLACRIGGEEFVVVMPDTASDIAAVVADRLRERIAATPITVHGVAEKVSTSISIGIAQSRGAAETPETLIKRADEALYEAKRQGRNRVVIAGG